MQPSKYPPLKIHPLQQDALFDTCPFFTDTKAVNIPWKLLSASGMNNLTPPPHFIINPWEGEGGVQTDINPYKKCKKPPVTPAQMKPPKAQESDILI